MIKESQPKNQTLMFKLTEADKKMIYKLAKKFTAGNVSLWVRYASLNFRPKKSK